ncbi:MAG: glutaredoxin 3 [Bdellovibrionaceae bacterium]|nr:glutaredoxin 3 [Pseudobdellovibrionaceae bacterium]
MNKKIVVYVKNHCPYCNRAKALLEHKELKFETINLEGKEEEYVKLKKKTGMMTVPQIFIGETFIGGYTELAAFEATGELDKILHSV